MTSVQGNAPSPTTPLPTASKPHVAHPAPPTSTKVEAKPAATQNPKPAAAGKK